MTIIAGFKCSEGIVLCADTLATVAGISKRSVPKLQFHPPGPHQGESLAVAFCGSGENGDWIDKVVNTAWGYAQSATTLDEACEKIDESIRDIYHEFGQIYQLGYCPTAELIYGVKMHDSCRLFRANGPTINENQGYTAAGAGYYMADFLAKRMYVKHLNIRQCAILAAYILFQSKEHVDGCGGESHIAVLREKGVSGKAAWPQVEAMTNLLQSADEDIGRLLLNAADVEMESTEFLGDAKVITEVLDIMRKHQKEQLESGSKDFFGLPLPTEG